MLSIRPAAASLSALSAKRIPMTGEANRRARLSADRGADSAGNVVKAIGDTVGDAARVQVRRSMGQTLFFSSRLGISLAPGGLPMHPGHISVGHIWPRSLSLD